MDLQTIGVWARACVQSVRTRLGRTLREKAVLLVLAITLTSMVLTPFVQAGVGLASPAYAQGQASAGTPNRFDPFADTTSVSHSSITVGPLAGNPSPGTMQRNTPLPMRPGSLLLQAGKAAHFVGSDGRLQVDVPAGAVTASDLVQTPGSALHLAISQIAPASGSSAGGSGHVSFGTYLLQLVDGAGKPVAHGLRQPIKLTLHYGANGSAIDVAHAFVTLNSGLPTSTASQVNSTLGDVSSQPTTLDPAGHTLTANITMTTASATASFNTDSPVATFGKPDPFNVDLNAGALTFNLPIDVPAGPGGLTPPINLSYSSAQISEQHNLQGAASWVGEGWNLSLGAISWAEHNVTTACTTCPSEWESSWQLSDPFGTAAELIPPNINVSTYYDDTPNVYYDKSNNSYPNEPIQWHTSVESHARIYSYVGPNTLPGVPAKVSCFRVYLPNGIMEEFGCTPDSVEYYFVPNNLNSQYIASWLLDLITDPEGNQIHITYQRQMVSAKVNNTDFSYTRDVVPATVEWDSPACHDAQHACTGSAWTPLVRVNFVASHKVARVTGTPYPKQACNSDTTLRCDDPKDLSGSGGMAAPEIQSTYALNDLQVQIRSSGSASWNTLTDYQLSYEVSGPGQMNDPVTNLPLSYAGVFDLTQIKVVGDDGNTALPTRTFSYIKGTQHYEDTALHAASGNCGPSWNTNCFLWSQTMDGNNRYIGSASNGLGLQQTFTWAEARNNTWGVPSGGDPTDPLSCDGKESQSPCFQADDENWSHMVLTSQTGTVVRSSSGGNTDVKSTTSYSYKLSHLGAQPCSACTVGMYWGNQNDADFLDFYNGKFMGFTQTSVTNPDGSVEIHHYKATGGWGLYDTSQVKCYTSNPCHNAPWWDAATALHGHEYETDVYDTDGKTLLKQVKTQYLLTCPPNGVQGTPASSTWGNWNGNLVSELDHNNPVAVCEIQTGQVDTFIFDGASSSQAVPHQTVSYTYDDLGRQTSSTTTSNDGGVNGSPTTIVQHTVYIQNINLSAAATSVTGTYLLDFPAESYTADAGNTVHTNCEFIGYDGQPFAAGQQSTLTRGEATTEDHYINCGTSTPGASRPPIGLIRTTTAHDQYGNQIATTDADANANISGHVGCTAGSAQHTACTTYDSTFAVLPVSSTNALNQSATTGYTQTAAGGFGLWPTSSTDANGQTTTTTYDALGRPTSTTLPGEGSGLTTTTTSYTVWCSGTSAQMPCFEVDTTQRLDSSTTVTSRAFYDGWGNLVETRTAAPNHQDVVQYAFYDPAGRRIFLSIPYFVPAYTGGPGASAFATPDAAQPGTSTKYNNLRSTTVTDALSHATTTTVSVECGQLNDSACYVLSATVDPLNHQTATFTDALDRQVYAATYTGNSSSAYVVYATTSTGYDLQGHAVKIVQPNGTSTTTFTYDDAGRQTGMNDPDRGQESYTYDPNGNLIESVDARGSAGTTFLGYDGLNRLIWRNTTNSPNGAYVTYSYDSTAGGNVGVGRLTGETFSGAGLSGSYSYVYDARGRQTKAILTMGSASYTTQATYDDADHILTQTYPDGEVVTTGYTAEGWLLGVSTKQGSTTTTLLGNADYTGVGGAAGNLTSASLGNGVYTYTASFDLLARPTAVKLSLASDGSTLFASQPSYDAVGNVSGVTTTLPQGTDTQVFCYDEQNRLTWAGSTGTPPCTSTAINAGTLTAARYQQAFSYDTLSRLTSGTLGSYTYGDSAHLHAATSIGAGYTASYDAAGNMTCRATTSSSTCAGSTPTGAALRYDNEGWLIQWQNAPANPDKTAGYLYDGEGNRVAQQVTQNGTAATTVYVGNLEEVTTSGSVTTTTTYYYAGKQRIALAVNGVFSYLGNDQIGSAVIALDSSGHVQASQLYAPYGGVRYQSGTMPGSYGFSGQRADAATGLDYYGARYYDPLAGQFISADTDDQGGLNRYSYVQGNPETLTDPTGHRYVCPGGCGGGSSGGSSGGKVGGSGGGRDGPIEPPPPPPPPHHNDGPPEARPHPVGPRPPHHDGPKEHRPTSSHHPRNVCSGCVGVSLTAIAASTGGKPCPTDDISSCDFYASYPQPKKDQIDAARGEARWAAAQFTAIAGVAEFLKRRVDLFLGIDNEVVRFLLKQLSAALETVRNTALFFAGLYALQEAMPDWMWSVSAVGNFHALALAALIVVQSVEAIMAGLLPLGLTLPGTYVALIGVQFMKKIIDDTAVHEANDLVFDPNDLS